ncbi:hypothetical protein V8E54_002644 [Elaphomyces granulatus]
MNLFSCKHLSLPQVDATKNKFAALVVNNWLYIDGGDIYAKWYGLNTNSSMVFSGLSYGLDGQIYNPDVVPTLWGFKPQSNGSVDWKSQSSTTNPQSAKLISNIAGGLAATSPTGHYNLGGFIDLSDNIDNNGFALEEMFSYNSGNRSWYNLTLAGKHYIFGEAQYVPIYGARGIILFFGGYWPSDRSVDSPSSLATLDTILIYDIDTNRFFKQPASNPPPGRALFCSVATGASNNESYEMCVSLAIAYNASTTNIYRRSFIYGGTRERDTPVPSELLANDFRTVHILTVPAFQWLQAPNQSPIRRLGHTSAPAYERPSLVSQFYANNSRYPIGWGDPELERIFTTPNGTATGNSSSNSNTSSINSSGHNSTGTETTINRTADTDVSGEIDVVGGVIGGSAALTIIALLIYWRLCRYKRREKPSQNPVELPG